MSTSRELKVPLTVHGFFLKLDTKKCDCIPANRPHWHLYNHGQKVGSISASGEWIEIELSVKTSVRQEVEELTKLYSRRIQDDYYFNKKNVVKGR